MFFFFLDLGKGSFSLLKELLVVCQLLAQPVVFCTQSLHLSLQLLLVSLQYVDVGRQCQHQLGKWEGTGCKGQVCGWCVGVYWWWGKKGGSINSERKYLRKYYQSAESSKSQKPLIQSRSALSANFYLFIEHILANTRSHLLCWEDVYWDDQDLETAISSMKSLDCS